MGSSFSACSSTGHISSSYPLSSAIHSRSRAAAFRFRSIRSAGGSGSTHGLGVAARHLVAGFGSLTVHCLLFVVVLFAGFFITLVPGLTRVEDNSQAHRLLL